MVSKKARKKAAKRLIKKANKKAALKKRSTALPVTSFRNKADSVMQFAEEPLDFAIDPTQDSGRKRFVGR